MLYGSLIDGGDEKAVELYLDVAEDKIRGLFGKRDLDKIFEYFGVGKIDKKGIFPFQQSLSIILCKRYFKI